MQRIITRQPHKGFTLVEISLFLGITMFLVVALIASSGSSISRQRYNDTTQDFIEFLRTAYAEATNIQNPRSFNLGVNDFCSLSDAATYGKFTAQDVTSLPSDQGRTGCAIYGKLITFGEKDNDPTIYSYDIIGQATSSTKLSGMSTLDALAAIRADVVTVRTDNPQTIATCNFAVTGIQNTYIPQWGARIESPTKGELFKGAVMIIRSPASGTVYTYAATNNSLFVQDLIQSPDGTVSCNALPSAKSYAKNHYGTLAGFLEKDPIDNYASFSATDVHLCLASDDASSVGNRRREIRIKTNGRSANAIEMIPMDSEENQCL